MKVFDRKLILVILLPVIYMSGSGYRSGEAEGQMKFMQTAKIHADSFCSRKLKPVWVSPVL